MLKLSEDIPAGQFDMATGSSGTASPNALVPEVLNRFNYEDWSLRVETYLLAEDLWDVVETSKEPPKQEDDEREFKVWRQKNAKALLAIQISCGPDAFSLIRNTRSAKVAWDILAAKFKPPQVNLPDYDETNTEDFNMFVPFFNAVRSGDWSTAMEFLNNNPDALSIRLIRASYSGKTVLHYAVDTGDAEIVRAVLELMEPEYLAIQANDGRTALAAVAEAGFMEMARLLITKNGTSAVIGDAYNMLPVVLASNRGHWNLAKYLLTVTPLEELLRNHNGAALLCQCIYDRKFDIARDLLNYDPKLVVGENHFGETPLKAWSSVPSGLSSGSRHSTFQRWAYNAIAIEQQESRPAHTGSVSDRGQGVYISFFYKMFLLKMLGLEMIYQVHVLSLDLLHLTAQVIKDLNPKEMQEGLVHEAISLAVEHGNVDFIAAICKANPELIWSTDHEKRTLLHLAIKYRQENVYDLINGLSTDSTLPNLVDMYNNNLLHMAAMISPWKRLNHIPGAALQMQRELQWFKEVERIVPKKLHESRNYTDHMTPRELFTYTHRELMKEGEKWMKDTANSCTVLGALVITIVFAAAITVPGGNDGSTGHPVFLNNTVFSVFMLSDAVSFFTSSMSLLIFWGIVTSRYAEDDFLVSLPLKMTIGFVSLLASINSMMIAFASAVYIMLDGKKLNIFTIVIVFAGIPVTLSVWMSFPLLVQMFVSTQVGVFKKKPKLW